MTQGYLRSLREPPDIGMATGTPPWDQRMLRVVVVLGRTLSIPDADSPAVTSTLPRADGQWQGLQTHGV